MLMNKKQKKMLVRILVSFALLVALYFIKADGIARFALYMIPYLIIGYDILKKAIKGIFKWWIKIINDLYKSRFCDEYYY